MTFAENQNDSDYHDDQKHGINRKQAGPSIRPSSQARSHQDWKRVELTHQYLLWLHCNIYIISILPLFHLSSNRDRLDPISDTILSLIEGAFLLSQQNLGSTFYIHIESGVLRVL